MLQCSLIINIDVVHLPDPDKGRNPAAVSHLHALSGAAHSQIRVTLTSFGRRWRASRATRGAWNDGSTEHLHQVIRAEQRSYNHVIRAPEKGCETVDEANGPSKAFGPGSVPMNHEMT